MRKVLLSTLMIFSLGVFASTLEITGRGLLFDQAMHVKPGPLGTVVIFMSAKCPCSNSHAQIIQKQSELHKNFAFVIVHSNADESLEMVRTYFKSSGVTIPVIEDQGFELANRFKAIKTPHAFVLTPSGETVFKGGVTDSTEGPTAKTNYLDLALKDIEAGRAVKVSQARALGCSISRTSSGDKHVH